MTGKLFSLHTRVKKNKAIYYCQFKLPDGSWSNAKSTGQTSRVKAESWAINYLHSGGVVVKENITFAEYSKGFFEWDGPWATDKKVRGLRISKQHCLEQTNLLNNKVNPNIGKLKLTSIDRSAIKKFRNTLFTKEYSGNTINKCLSVIKAVLEDAEEKSLIKYVPRIDRAADHPKTKGILTMDEVKQLFSVEWEDYRGYVGSLLAASTGLRLGELQALTISDLHMEGNYITVKCSWNNRLTELNATTKTGKIRNIFVPDHIKTEVLNLITINPYEIRPDTYLFYADRSENKPCEPRIFTRSLYKAMEKIGIYENERTKRNLTMHSWRHWLNSLLINARIPLQKVQSITGHVTADMSQHYYKLDDMADVLKVTGNIFSDNVH